MGLVVNLKTMQQPSQPFYWPLSKGFVYSEAKLFRGTIIVDVILSREGI